VTPLIALTIAGSDSGGGAGIQADLRTFAAFGLHGASAVTALTAQSTVEVRAVLATPALFLREQIETVLDDLAVAAVKTGMLATAENVVVVAEMAAAGRLPNLVVDPVMVSSTGARLLDPDAETAYAELLLPHAVVATPNSREAAVLSGAPVDGVAGQEAAARALTATGALWVVVKGGDQDGAGAVDVLAGAGAVDVLAGDGAVDVLAGAGADPVRLSAARLATANTHGTGCSFAAAVAAGLARGDDPPTAVARAKAYVHAALARAADWRLGGGHGPIDHLDLAHPAADRLS
jgi:hydroxymethylpyrimidine/phosphomethylpyrimidine kinase